MEKYQVTHTGHSLRVNKEVTRKRFVLSKLRSILETNYELVSKEGGVPLRDTKSNLIRPVQPAEYHTWDKVMKEIKKWHNGNESAYEVVNKPMHVKK